ncbi:hypothetical protein COCNU_11G012110 [Cocos nucifera]|uniref:C2H2-type domain-containing protein n=1 Tax=Cocos nucifera TaxID=13894 RepID=A0A8K0N9U1_COCNU|nr:hypothetical protein COCNU_11G012110 [Cocos nucifera]
MDFRYRTAEDHDPSLFSSSSSTSVNGYFTEKALRAGYIDVVGDIRRGDLIRPIPSKESVQRELQNELIREELIGRDIAQRRILEEEVRRELELERAMATRWLHMERYSSVAGSWVHPEAGLERGMQFGPETRIGDRFRAPPRVPVYPDDTVHEWSPPPPPVPSKLVVGRKLPLPQHQPEVSPFREIIPLKPESSGMKRKAVAVTRGGELPRPSQKDWSCALCQVSATSKQGLDEHLQGKRHTANQEALIEGKRPKATEAPFDANKITTAKKAVGSTSVMKFTGRSLPAEGASTKGPLKNRREDRKQQAVQKKSYFVTFAR